MQVLANHTLIAPVITAVEQPILLFALQVNGSSRAEIEHRDPGNQLFGPMRVSWVKMPAGNVRENLHDSEDKPAQRPVGIVKDHSQARQHRRRTNREKSDGEYDAGTPHTEHVG